MAHDGFSATYHDSLHPSVLNRAILMNARQRTECILLMLLFITLRIIRYLWRRLSATPGDVSVGSGAARRRLV